MVTKNYLFIEVRRWGLFAEAPGREEKGRLGK